MIKILFVCHGNICRSPMAEFVMKDMVNRAGKHADFEIASAGTSGEELGNPIYPPIRRLLEQHGIPYERRCARKLTAADYRKYDMLVCMDGRNLRNLHAICGGDPDGKISLLLDHLHGGDVADPWYTGDFESAWNDIESGCRALFEKLSEKL